MRQLNAKNNLFALILFLMLSFSNIFGQTGTIETKDEQLPNTTMKSVFNETKSIFQKNNYIGIIMGVLVMVGIAMYLSFGGPGDKKVVHKKTKRVSKK